MGYKNLHTYQNQDDAAEDAWLQATGQGPAETEAEIGAEDAEQEGDHADDHQRKGELGEGAIACTRKRDADGQGIDARGDGQHQLGVEATGVEVLLLLGLKGLADHVTADEDQQAKGDPVVVGL